MLLVSAVQIVIGWAWHTAHRAKLHWSLRREGTLIAAAAVALIGAAETIRSSVGKDDARLTDASSLRASRATGRPVLTEAKPLEVNPNDPAGAIEAIGTIEAAPSPSVETVSAADPIAHKIMERLGDSAQTGSIAADEPAPAAIKKKAKRVLPTKTGRRKAQKTAGE